MATFSSLLVIEGRCNHRRKSALGQARLSVSAGGPVCLFGSVRVERSLFPKCSVETSDLDYSAGGKNGVQMRRAACQTLLGGLGLNPLKTCRKFR